MSKVLVLKTFKCELGPLILSVEQFVSADMKNTVAFYFNTKNIWEKSFSNYIAAESKFLTIRNILKKFRIQYSNLSAEELTTTKVKEISHELLLEFKKYK